MKGGWSTGRGGGNGEGSSGSEGYYGTDGEVYSGMETGILLFLQTDFSIKVDAVVTTFPKVPY